MIGLAYSKDTDTYKHILLKTMHPNDKRNKVHLDN